MENKQIVADDCSDWFLNLPFEKLIEDWHYEEKTGYKNEQKNGNIIKRISVFKHDKKRKILK